MIPQKHVDEILPEEQVQSSVEEKKTRLSVKKRAMIKLLLVSVVLFAAGASYPSLSFEGLNHDMGGWLFLGSLFAFIGGLVGGVVTRSYWSLLSVPGSLLIGLMFGVQLLGSPGDVTAVWAVIIYLPLFPAVAFFGAVFGTPRHTY